MATKSLIKSVSAVALRVLEGLDMYSPEALELVMRTGMVESGFEFLEQHPRGPGLGFFQSELGMSGAEDTWFNFVWSREWLKRALRDLGIKAGPWTKFDIMSNIALQVALCRIKYWRDPDPIPKDIEEQAYYWKTVYNTEKGKGTIEDFIAAAYRLE